jgi:hypothetical protein
MYLSPGVLIPRRLGVREESSEGSRNLDTGPTVVDTSIGCGHAMETATICGDITGIRHLRRAARPNRGSSTSTSGIRV